MEKKLMFVVLTGLMLVSVFAVAVSAITIQFRPMNTMDHPGLTNPFQHKAEGPNHAGASDYMNKWLGISELCEQGDIQLRPANQGYNILRFFFCSSGD